jgi:hypothetical protein
MDFLGRHVLRIDFDRGELLFLRSAPAGSGEAVPIEWRPGEYPRVMAGFAGMDPVPFEVDTGSITQDTGTLGAFVIRRLLIEDQLRELGPANLVTSRGKSSSRVYRGKRLTLGGHAVDSPVFKGTEILNCTFREILHHHAARLSSRSATT